jgi:hypothetical protein
MIDSSSSCLTDAGVERQRPALTSFIIFALNKLNFPQLFLLLPRLCLGTEAQWAGAR